MRGWITTLTALLFASIVAQTGPAAAAAFLRIDGIPGEATDNQHKGWIVVGLSVDVEVVDRMPPRGSGQLVITKRVDKATPKLAEAVANGQHIARVVLSLSGSGSTPYHRYELRNVLISSYSVSGQTERYTLSYQSIARQ